MTEQSYRNSITISNGSLEIFYQKPISLAFLILAAASLTYALIKHYKASAAQ